MDTVRGHNFEPEVFVDVSTVIDTKTAMLNSHISQGAWIRECYDGAELTDGMLAQARFRGGQAGCQYAEGFQLLHDWPYTGDARLLP
jgi:LmbE family N-acetylglucosaminyl deacetylase